MSSIWDGVDLDAEIMERFEPDLHSAFDIIRFDIAKESPVELLSRLKHSLFASAESVYDDHSLPLPRNEIREMYLNYERQIYAEYNTRNNQIEKIIPKIIENKGQQFTKREKATLYQFYKAIKELDPFLSRSKRLSKEYVERNAHKMYIGLNSLKLWYEIYLKEVPLKRLEVKDLPIPAPAPEPTFKPSYTRRIPKPKPFKVDSETRENIREEQKKFLRQNRITVDNDDIMPYPFKSKVKEYKKRFPDTPYQDIPVDPKVESRTRKLEKPYFSPEPHSWEIDLVFNLLEQGDIYLFCININTKFLVVYRVKSKSANDVLPALEDLRNNFEVKSVKGDGERSFAAEDTREFWQHYHIKTYFSKTKFTNHNRIVDSVIRTIRNAIGYRNINEEQLKQIINYYNNTKHSSTGFTPIEMMNDIDKEFYFIRRCNERLIDVKKRLPKLKQGNVVIVHLELGKVAGKFEKKRKTFDRIGIFQEYINGNVRVKVSPPVQISSGSWRTDLLVPEYAVRYIAESIDTLPEKYKRTFYSDVFIPKEENEE